ncbi:MAG: hypothetical protein ACOYL8_02375 [Patescibacteria group bacterium]
MKANKKEFGKIDELFAMLLRKRYTVEEIEMSINAIITEASNRKISIFLNYLEEILNDKEAVSLENIPERVSRKKAFFSLYLSMLKYLPLGWSTKKFEIVISVSELSKTYNYEIMLHGIVMKVIRNYSKKELLKNKSLIDEYSKVVGVDPQRQQQLTNVNDLLALKSLAADKISVLRHDSGFIYRCSKEQDKEVSSLATILLEKIGGKKKTKADEVRSNDVAKLCLQFTEILWK